MTELTLKFLKILYSQGKVYLFFPTIDKFIADLLIMIRFLDLFSVYN